MRGRIVQIDELHKMSALMGPPTMQTWPEGVLLAAGMGFSFTAQQPIPLHLMVRHRIAWLSVNAEPQWHISG